MLGEQVVNTTQTMWLILVPDSGWSCNRASDNRGADHPHLAQSQIYSILTNLASGHRSSAMREGKNHSGQMDLAGPVTH